MSAWSGRRFAGGGALAVAALVSLLGACGGSGPDHLPFPQATTFDGALLSPLRIVTIVAGNDTGAAPTLFAFSDGIGRSRWWSEMQLEYHLATAEAAPGVMGPPLTADVTDHDVYDYITGAIAGDATLARNGRSLYLLYLPPGITIISDGVANTNCDHFSAYHYTFGTRGDNLAVVQWCSQTDTLDDLTVRASHEIIEAATDPDLNSWSLPVVTTYHPWTEDVWSSSELGARVEVGDICEGTYWYESSRFYQRVWSNAAARGGGDPCVPGIGEPYYSTTFDKGWYPLGPGGTVSIPVVGWATGSTPAWGLHAEVDGIVPGFTVSLPAGVTTLTAGARTMLTVVAPSTAPSGSFAVVRLLSTRPTVQDGLPHTDGAHFAFVGVYVP
jgi:hypothetical protein